MHVNTRALMIVSLVALVFGLTFILMVTKEHPDALLNISTQGPQASTTAATSSDDHHTAYTPSSPNEGWMEIRQKRYGYLYYLPKDTQGGLFEVETFTEGGNLSEFVQELLTLNTDEPDPTISSVEKVVVNRMEGYQFFVTEGFDNPYGGYILDGKHRFLIFENSQGEKLVVHYRIDYVTTSLSEQILDTFIISENLIPVKQDPSLWQSVTLEGFSFQYPGNLFKVREPIGPDNVSLESTEQDVYGNMYAVYEAAVLNPKSIEGPYGTITDAETVVVGTRTWYLYGVGDAGCGGEVYVTTLGSGTLKTVFNGCPDDDAHPVYDEPGLQKEILSRFEF